VECYNHTLRCLIGKNYMTIDFKVNCARLERPDTDSWLTVESTVSFTFREWETIIKDNFPGWELVTCGDDIN
jgi:hypothetical protein